MDAIPGEAVTASEAWTRWRVAVQESGDAPPLCLALANTRHWRLAAQPADELAGFGDLVRFAHREGLLDEAGAARLADTGSRHARAAQAELAATIALREAIHDVVSARIRGHAPAEADLMLITANLNAAVAGLALELRAGALVPHTRRAVARLDGVRLQCAVSAIALLTGPHADRVKACADDRGCGRLFVDATRNGSRRFCFSGECGNRARQAAFRARHRRGGEAEAR
jgi:predicted RNA-binding Zn ribbon-like protein